MPSHVTKTRWSVKTRSLQFKIYPRDRPKHCRTNTQKTKGGTLGWQNIFFQKFALIFFETRSNDCICWADSEKVYNWGLCSLYVMCTLRARCISRTRSVHRYNGCYDLMSYTFSKSAWQMQSFGSVLKMIGDNISSFCDVRRHVSARIEIQKFCSTLHPSVWLKRHIIMR